VHGSVFAEHRRGNAAMYYVDGHDAFAAIADAIQAARREVLIGA
jgi:phosphatidylserine/phosphatidylglycerophosphate/cardiolipin synthase-like enzyme